MTPQQRLQEAKDQAAKEMCPGHTWDDVRFYVSMSHDDEENVYNRFGELMYEAGKSECNAENRDLRARCIGLEEDIETYRKALERIANMGQDVGIEGCTWGDTDYDSMSAVAGYNQCLENVQEIASDALKCKP